MHRLVGLPALLSSWASVACAVSWLVVLVGVPVVALRATRESRRDLWVALLLGSLGLILRLALPWGPLNFVDAERLGPLWLLESWPDPLFASVPSAFDGLRSLGVEPAILMRFWGPTFGALAVMATYAAARACGVGTAASAIGALVVACFPPHLHYSTGPILSVEAGALCAAAIAVAAAGPLGIETVPLLAALTTLAVYTRPECRLLVLPVALLALGPQWSWRRRLALIGLLLLSLGGYVPLAISPSTLASPVPECMRRFAVSLVRNPLTFGLPWIIAALGGLLFGKVLRRSRLALGVLILGIVVTDAVGGSDPSPQWGQWRYFVVLVPVVATAAAILLERLNLHRRPLVVVGLVLLAISPVQAALPTLRAANDQQAAYTFVRETAHQVLPPDGTVYVLRSADTAAPQSATLLGLASVFGPFEGVQWGCRFELPPNPAVRVRVIDAETLQCPDWVRANGSVLYLGPDRSEPMIDQLRKDYELVPLASRAQRVVLDMPDVSLATCSNEGGLRGPTSDVHFGWYALKPKAPPSP